MTDKEKTASLAGRGGPVDWKVVATSFCHNPAKIAINPDDGSYAVAVIAERFRVPPATAFEVFRMAGLGVR
jgi:hypothetical protein